MFWQIREVFISFLRNKPISENNKNKNNYKKIILLEDGELK